MPDVHEEIGMTIADAGVAHRHALESQFIDHAARGCAWRVFENAAGAFLTERLARAPLFVADTNPVKNFFFFFEGYGHHRDLHPFPTRRSSDLTAPSTPSRGSLASRLRHPAGDTACGRRC